MISINIKKRTILSVVITVIVLIATFKHWFIFGAVPVNMDVAGQGTCNIEVLLNKKDNDAFNKIQTDKVEINLDESNHASLYIKNLIYPKRVRFLITDLKPENNITLSNIKIGKYKLKNLEQFEVNGAALSVDNDKLILNPNFSTAILTYPQTLNIRASIKFDFKIFIIILILSYLLTYKLSDYIADFKAVKGKSRIEIIFLTIFFIFLFVPLSNINVQEISHKENRTLAKWYPIIKENNEINFNFGKNFNEWFNDRFCLRDELISYNDAKLLISRNWKTKDVIKGKNEWLFLGWKEATDCYSNSVLFTGDELAKIYKYLNDINNYCKKHNKKFYVYIAPDKSKIYEEFYTDSIKKISNESKTEQLIKHIKQNSDIKIIYPKDALISSKKEGILYWKTDTHWNELGAYYGYSALLNEINKDFKTLKLYKITNYSEEIHNGDLYNMSPSLLRKPDSTLYKIPEIKNYENICKIPEEPTGIVSCYNTNGKKNLLMFRDSFSASLIPYLSQSFKNSSYVWQYNVAPHIMDSADIIVLEVVERYLPKLINSYME